jgi:hypothetical protein
MVVSADDNSLTIVKNVDQAFPRYIIVAGILWHFKNTTEYNKAIYVKRDNSHVE